MLGLCLLYTYFLTTKIKAELLTYGAPSFEVREDAVYTVTLTQSFPFAGSSYSTVYISDNGVVSLVSTFKGGTLDKYQYEDVQWIAPYGADVGRRDYVPGELMLSLSQYRRYLFASASASAAQCLKKGIFVGGGSYGLLYYAEVPSTDSATLQIVRELIEAEYPDTTSFSPALVLVVTWENVRPFPAPQNTQENTFQAVITTDGSKSFIIFLYKQLNWGPAVVGISSGVSSNNYFICGSGTDIVKSLTVKSQNECHAPGQYVFRVDGSSWHTGGYTCTQISSPRDCTATVPNTSRNKRCRLR